ncbi:pilus assembly protein PilG [Corallococcus sp. BB11-1]|uniref:pilus assembly protein PilG n=1 Tax=Corallococcus sp. BB11-1 TaxID=2996783 RepID=UPI0010D6B01F|nr:pilus assembly protein PilG [Corallococcus sp. BB11-1]MCY1035622.1 pilus assembly protein PilG [Corallococcus sp. BB11-1]RYZ44397.1 MAG: pilus assembly protein PilG [Myxococcaceae bacterium]
MRKLPLLRFVPGLLLVALLSAPPVPPRRQGGGPLLPRPDLLNALFTAQKGLVTDYFWILMLNRIGSAVRPEEYRHISDYAELVTTLDPKFRQAYLYGGLTIPVYVGGGRYLNTEESTALLRKGVANISHDQPLTFQLAYNLMFFERKYKEAADLIREMSRWEGAPAYYGPLATRLYAQSGDFDASMSLTVALRDSAEDEESRAFYEQRIREIQQERVLKGIDAAIARYQAREGRLPDTLGALVTAGDLRQLPADPLGGELFLGQDGRAYSNASRFRLELIEDQKTEAGERIVPKPRATTSHDDSQP